MGERAGDSASAINIVPGAKKLEVWGFFFVFCLVWFWVFPPLVLKSILNECYFEKKKKLDSGVQSQ